VGKHRAPAEQEGKEPGKRPPWQKRLWGWTQFGEKKLWDWLQLLSALAIPVVLTVAGFWYSSQQEKQQQHIEDQRAASDRDIEEQRAQDAALQAYLDQMSGLLLEENLRDSWEGSEARRLARARTLTVLGRLSPDRKGSVVRFLYESALIQEGNPIVDLATADLSNADLSPTFDLKTANLSDANLRGADLKTAYLSDANLTSANLSNADLSYADLSNADLRFADLSRTDLRGADLRGADLSSADLSNADLSGAYGVTKRELEGQFVNLENTIMPNGTTHD
jgi:pentapeptide repeat protein